MVIGGIFVAAGIEIGTSLFMPGGLGIRELAVITKEKKHERK